jgi:hypothetical protein
MRRKKYVCVHKRMLRTINGLVLWRVWLVKRQIIFGFWILYLCLLDIHQAEFTINYYSLNLCTTVLIKPCNHTWNLHRLTPCIPPPLLITIRCLACVLLAASLIHFSLQSLLIWNCCVPLNSHSLDSLDSNWNWLHTRYISTTNDHTGNISASIVDMCVPSHCIAMVSTLTT